MSERNNLLSGDDMTITAYSAQNMHQKGLEVAKKIYTMLKEEGFTPVMAVGILEDVKFALLLARLR